MMFKNDSENTENTPVLAILSVEDLDADKDFDPYNTVTDLQKLINE